MADLDFEKRAEPSSIVGMDDEGSETNFMKVSENNDAHGTDICNTAGLNGAVTANNTTAVEVKVGANALLVRKMVHIQSKGQGVFWGYSNAVTVGNGTELFKNQLSLIPVGPNISIWLICTAATIDVRIGELA